MKKLMAVSILVLFLLSAAPIMANTPLSQAQILAKAAALAEKYGVQLGIEPPLDFDFAAAERALSASRSSRVTETVLSETVIPTTLAHGADSVEVYCKKKYWHLGIYTEFAVAADAHYVSDAHGQPDFFSSIDPADYSVAGGGNASFNVEIRHVNGVRSWLSNSHEANVDARYTVRYWTFGFFTDVPDTCPGSLSI